MHTTRGNIVFFILLAVALFAALSHAVTSSMRGGGKGMSDEKAKLIAADILGKIALQETELMRFMERTNRKIHEIDFYAEPYRSAANSGNSPFCASTDCDFWHPDGGNMMLMMPMSAYYNHPGMVSSCLPGGVHKRHEDGIAGYLMAFSVAGLGTQASDLFLYYHCIHPKICAEINIQEGVRQRDEAPATGFTHTGGYALFQHSTVNGLPDTAPDHVSHPQVAGRRVFCDEGTYANGSRLYAALYVR